MEKKYQIQFTEDSGDRWADRIGSKYPYNDEGLARAIADIRHLAKLFKEERIQYRLICVTVEVMDIHL